MENQLYQQPLIDSFYSAMPNAENVSRIEISHKEKDQVAQANTDQRMQNYFNCIDDYSWGGLCDQASDQARQRRMLILSKLKEQLENGAFVEVINTVQLHDMDGNLVTTNLIKGAYGLCFKIPSNVENGNPQFVGMAKKQATFEKKGFQCKYVANTVEYYYTGKVSQSGNLKMKARILSSELHIGIPEKFESGNSLKLFYALNPEE